MKFISSFFYTNIKKNSIIKTIGSEKMVKKLIQKVKNNKFLVAVIILLTIIITLITKKIIFKENLIIDKIAYDILVTKLRSEPLTTFMKLVTKLSNITAIAVFSIIFAILFYYLKKKKVSYLIIANPVFIALVNQMFKFIFKRNRPSGFEIINMKGYSFPSGHAMVSMAFYGLLIYIIYHYIKNKKIKNILIALNVTIIILIGISRIYLGVHYLSDIITGYCISIIYLLILTKLLNKYHIIP